MEYILEAKELGKTYYPDKNNSHEVLKNVNIKIAKGGFVSVMGPSGSGKSTLLYNISSMDKPSAGQVFFNGREITYLHEQALSEIRLKKMGFIFQQHNLLKNLNIFDNIILPAYLENSESRDIINKRAFALMEQTGISETACKDITQASGGQLQRAAVCRALINNPEIVFGDEPTGALNSKAASEVMDILADINSSGTSVLLVTHDIKVAAKTEKVFFMTDGSIAGELDMSKYDRKARNLKEREETLSQWLIKMEF